MKDLFEGGLLAIEAILDEATACPREEVIYEAAALLASFPVTPSLLQELGNVVRSDSRPIRRALVTRTLGYLQGMHEARRAILELALQDEDPEVRDRAAIALAEVGGPRSKELLQAALGRERSGVVRDSIREALAELST